MKKPIYLIHVIVLYTAQLFLIGCNNSDDTIIPDTITPNNEIHEVLLQATSDQARPGMIAAIMDHEGILLIESAGLRKINSEEALTIHDKIHLGSCTKSMTATMLATLVSEGLLTWETTIVEIFPELSESIHTDYHEATLHDLVTHRSGIATNARNWMLGQDLEIKERRLAIIKDNLSAASQVKDGEFEYSNLAYMIAGAMAERVTGQSWEELMQARLFDPLGMTSAGFGHPGSPGQVDQPWGHVKFSSNWVPVQEDNPEALGPAGIVHSSFEDWAKYIALQLPLSTSAILTRDQLSFLVNPEGDYASGWGIGFREWANGVVYSHSGSNTKWYSVVWVAPELDRAYMVATNSADDDTARDIDNVVAKLIDYDQQ